MTNNAIINARLKDMLNVLDARATVNIYVENRLFEKQTSVKYSQVYEILADKDFIEEFGDYDVIGFISVINTTNILIKEV